MNKAGMASTGFRKRLRAELAAWQEEGLVTAEQAENLSVRYALGDLPHESAGFLVASIYAIGAALILGGIISFIAANWQALGAGVKVSLIVFAMLACHGGGVYLWKIRGSHARLGHVLVVLGTLIFGANIGLMAQIFHIHSDFYNGFGAWAVGAVVMAYLAGSVPNAVIAIIASFFWYCGRTEHFSSAFNYYPFVAAAVFVPFAYIHRSVVSLFLAMPAIAISVLIGVGLDCDQATAVILAALAMSSLYIAWGLVLLRNEQFRRMSVVALLMGVVGLTLTAYVLSFFDDEELWRGWQMKGWQWLIPVILAALASVPLWISSLMSLWNRPAYRPLMLAMLAGLLLTGGACVSGYSFAMALAANAAGLVVGGGLLFCGVRWEDRRVFWAGLLWVMLIVLTLFFRYETGLLQKAAGFLACGVGVMVGGVKYEKHLRQRRATHDAQ